MAMRRLARDGIIPRGLVDDNLRSFWSALEGCIEDVKGLGLGIQASESGFVATQKEVIKASKTAADYCHIPSKMRMRNLRHELDGPRIRRPITNHRMTVPTQRIKRVQSFRRTVGIRV
eukprot:6672684-Pyramimonas_sp.AAC.1